MHARQHINIESQKNKIAFLSFIDKFSLKKMENSLNKKNLMQAILIHFEIAS